MLPRKRSAATQATPSVAISATMVAATTTDAAFLNPRRLTIAVAGTSGGRAAATATPAGAGTGSGSVGGTTEFAIGNLEFGMTRVERAFASVESGMARSDFGPAPVEFPIGP